MNLVSVISVVQRRLESWNPVNAESIITEELDYTQQAVLEEDVFQPWFLATENSSYQTESGEPRVSLPDDFMAEMEENALRVQVDGVWQPPMEKKDEESIFERYGDTLSIPKEYAFSYPYFVLGPIPDGEYFLRMKYYAHQSLPSADDEKNRWMIEGVDWLVSQTAERLAGRLIKDASLMRVLERDVEQARSRLYKKHISLQEVNRNPSPEN